MRQPKSSWHRFVLQAQHSSDGTQKVGNVFPSWQDFVFALRNQFYPLGDKEKALIEWKCLKLRKGQTLK
jgi:hypothetical protein